MKKYILFSIIVILTLFNINYVNAESCDANDIKRLKVLASNIDITYEYNDNLKDSDGFIIYDTYKVVINNTSDELYLIETKTNTDLRDYPINDGSITIDRLQSGNKTFKVYSVACDKSLRTIYEDLPKFNYYSTDPNCEDRDDLDVCKKFYDTSNLEYYEFYNIVTADNDVETNKDKDSSINKFIDIIKNNYIYFGIAAGVLIILIVILLVRRHKKRGVLE